MRFDDLKEMDNAGKRADDVTVGSTLVNLRYFAKRITDAYDIWNMGDQNKLESQLIFDSIRSNLNDYVQAFMELVLSIRLAKGDSRTDHSASLRSLIRYFLSGGYELSADCRRWVEFLQRRNALIHEYYNYEFMNEELERALANCGAGVCELPEVLEKTVAELQIEDFVIKRVGK